MWVRRASIVGLIPRARKRRVARSGLRDRAAAARAIEEDLIQKAVGWALREAGKADMARLERYLRDERPVDSAHDAALRDRTIQHFETARPSCGDSARWQLQEPAPPVWPTTVWPVTFCSVTRERDGASASCVGVGPHALMMKGIYGRRSNLHRDMQP